MIKTLKKRFVFSAMLAVTILLAFLLGAINIFNGIASYRQANDLLSALADNRTERPVQTPPKPDRQDFFNEPLTEDTKMGAVYFKVYLNNSGEIIGSDTGRIASVEEGDVRSYIDKATNDSGTVDKFRYMRTQNEMGATYVFLDITAQTNSVWRIIALSFLLGLLCWLVMLLIVILISKKAIQPIADNMEKQKRFVTDAGHEIKTPLAIILANTDAMELYGGETKWSKNIRAQVNRLNGLMQNLLTLARADETKDILKEEVFLNELLTETLGMFSATMELNGLTLNATLENDICFHGSKAQLTQLFSILADNAVKYAQKGTAIDISLKKHEKGFLFSITNITSALPDCAPEKLFDRFYRSDDARTQRNGGYGIGLSAARAICEIHKGSISANFDKGNRVTFTVKL